MQLLQCARISFILIWYLMVNMLWAGGGGPELTEFHGAYLGQQLPGLKPEPFAPGIFSVWSDYGFHLTSSVLFAPQGKELVFTDQTLPIAPSCSCMIWHMQQMNSTWSRPRVVPFSGDYGDKCVGYERDAGGLYFASTRPIHGDDIPRNFDVWFVKKENGSWAAPVRLGYPINTLSNDIGVVVSDDGTMYFSSDRPGGKGGFDIYRSQLVDGQYSLVENLGDSVNTDGEDYVVCTAPDASFLILYNFDMTDRASAGLYITFRKESGIWTRAKSMGDHINDFDACSASLSPDGEYLFILKRGDGMYWLKSDLIGYLESEDLNISAILLETFERGGLRAALAMYGELKERHSDFIDVDEYLLNQRGHNLLRTGHVDRAIVLFEICVAINPDSWNAYDSLGEAYIKAGLINQAIESYERSLELNSRNNNAAGMLELLRR